MWIWTREEEEEGINIGYSSQDISDGVDSHPLHFTSISLSTNSIVAYFLDLLYDSFANAVNDVADIIIGYIRSCWQAEAYLKEGF